LPRAINSAIGVRDGAALYLVNPEQLTQGLTYNLTNGSFSDLVLWENPFGNTSEHDIDKYIAIAYAKAFTSYLTGLPSHQVQQVMPSLYVPGMTKWGGSAIAGTGPMRLITAFSGVQWNFDQMISEMMISAIQALCHEQMREIMASDEAMIQRPASIAT